ncbi:MAG: ABC-F family ATP-binding cassette domain-containing protein [Hyphomicrobiaceae bacterium]|nr:ABC-F family ATP-binding cassette domain-containing protein [Hyphomicrobiaceae bacterium]
MPAQISLNALSYRTPDGRLLFDHLDLSFAAERTAIVGANGIGKSTLLHLITGDLPPLSGSVSRVGTAALLEQDPAPFAGETLAQRFGIEEQLARLDRIVAGKGNDEDLIEADWDVETRFQAALELMSLPPLSPQRHVKGLSGGQQTRLSLAALVFCEPDMLLLDEPTNNLDRGGRDAVADLLGKWRGGTIIVSHDRQLLREMDRIVELSSLGVKSYGGGWDVYSEQKAIERNAAEAAFAHAERKRSEIARKIQNTKEKKAKSDAHGKKARAKGGMPKILLNAMQNRAENSTGRLSATTTKMQEKADEAAENARQNIERLRSPIVDLPGTNLPSGKNVLKISDVTAGYDGENPILRKFNLDIAGPERIALVGPNGSGKSTLFRLISGALPPIAGDVQCFTSFALLDQQVTLLNGDETIRDNFLRLNSGETENACRAALARFLFRADAALRRVEDLSGGEKLRVGLACTLGSKTPPPLLLLDEPTNHLDLQSIAAIEDGIRGFDGALIVASHDEDFLDAIGITRRVDLSKSAQA